MSLVSCALEAHNARATSSLSTASDVTSQTSRRRCWQLSGCSSPTIQASYGHGNRASVWQALPRPGHGAATCQATMQPYLHLRTLCSSPAPWQPTSRSTSAVGAAVCAPPPPAAEPNRSQTPRPHSQSSRLESQPPRMQSGSSGRQRASDLGAAHDNMHPAVVMRRIKSARSIWGLRQCWDSCSHAFNTVHCSAALLKLAMLSQSQPSHAIAPGIRPRIPTQSAFNHSEHTLSTMPVLPSDHAVSSTTNHNSVHMQQAAFSASVDASLHVPQQQQHEHQQNSQALSNLPLTNTSPQQHQQQQTPSHVPWTENQQHIQHSQQQPSNQPSLLDGTGPVGSMDGDSELHPKPCPLLSQLLHVLRSQVHVMDCCGMANTVQALGMLQHHDRAMLEDLLRASGPKLPQFSLPQLTATMRGLAQLHCRPDSAWLNRFYTAVTVHLGHPPTPPPPPTSTSSNAHPAPAKTTQPPLPAVTGTQSIEPSQALLIPLARPSQPSAQHTPLIRPVRPRPVATVRPATPAAPSMPSFNLTTPIPTWADQWQKAAPALPSTAAPQASGTRTNHGLTVSPQPMHSFDPTPTTAQAMLSAATSQLSLAHSNHSLTTNSGARVHPNYSPHTNHSLTTSPHVSFTNLTNYNAVDSKSVPGPNTISCVVGCLWGLERLGCCPPPDWISLLIRSVEPAHASPKELAGLVFALAKLQYAPPGAWTAQVLAVTQERLDSSRARAFPLFGSSNKHFSKTPVSLGAVATPEGLTSLKSGPKPGSNGGKEATTAGSTPLNVRASEDMNSILAIDAHATGSQAHSWQLADCVMMLWALSKLRVPLSPSWLLSCKALVLLQLPTAQPRELVMVLHSLAMQQGTSGSKGGKAALHRQPHALVALRQTKPHAKYRQARPYGRRWQGRGHVLRFAGRGRKEQDRPLSAGDAEQEPITRDQELDTLLADAVLAQVLRCRSAFRPRDLLSVLLYCARLRLRPCHAWMLAILPQLQRHLSEASALDLTHTAYGLARIKATPGSTFLRDLVTASGSFHKLRTFSPQQLANLCWGLATLRATPSVAWLKSAHRSMHAFRSRLLDVEVRQLRWALMRMAMGHCYRQQPRSIWRLEPGEVNAAVRTSLTLRTGPGVSSRAGSRRVLP